MANSTKRTSTSTASNGEEAANAAAAGTLGLAEVARHQMAAAADMVSAMFRAQEAVHRAAMQMGERVSLLHGQAAENIRKASSPIELVSVQSTLAMYQAQEAMRYWQDLALAMGRATAAQGEDANEAAAAAPGAASMMMDAAMNAAAPMADAFQQLMTAPLRAAASSSPTQH